MSLRLADPPVYGPVFQGEGVMIGTPTVFVRAAGCDYRCSWCDTMYAVDPKRFKHEWQRHEVADLVAKVTELMPHRGWVTLSGGNPALQNFGPLVNKLHEASFLVAVESQGSRAPAWFKDVDHLTLSPKPPSSGEATTTAQVQAALSALGEDYGLGVAALGIPRACVKIVVFDERDLSYAQDVFAAVWGHPHNPACVLQAGSPEGATRDQLLERLAWLEEQARHLGFRVLPQLHAVTHGVRRDG